MEVYDIIMLVILLGAAVFGAWKGFAWQIAFLGALVASYFVALEYREEVAQFISAKPPWNIFIAMLVLYIGTSLAIWIGFRLVSGFIDRLKLKEFDRQIGALFGLANGVLLCVIVTLFAVALSGESQRKAIIQSRSGYYIARLLDKARALMPDETNEIWESGLLNIEPEPDSLQQPDSIQVPDSSSSPQIRATHGGPARASGVRGRNPRENRASYRT